MFRWIVRGDTEGNQRWITRRFYRTVPILTPGFQEVQEEKSIATTRKRAIFSHEKQWKNYSLGFHIGYHNYARVYVTLFSFLLLICICYSISLTFSPSVFPRAVLQRFHGSIDTGNHSCSYIPMFTVCDLFSILL